MSSYQRMKTYSNILSTFTDQGNIFTRQWSRLTWSEVFQIDFSRPEESIGKKQTVSDSILFNTYNTHTTWRTLPGVLIESGKTCATILVGKFTSNQITQITQKLKAACVHSEVYIHTKSHGEGHHPELTNHTCSDAQTQHYELPHTQYYQPLF